MCQHYTYKVHQRDGDNVGLLVSPDRILVDCEDQYAGGGDRPGSFAFMIYILDEEKTIFTAFQSSQLDKSECNEKATTVATILRKSKKVYVAGWGVNLDEPRKTEKWSHTFPRFGAFHLNGRSMQLSALKGEDGTCVTAHQGYGKPCPWDPIFPENSLPFLIPPKHHIHFI